MAQNSVANQHVSIRNACRWFQISETCYRYEPKLQSENEHIANLLLELCNSEERSDWGLACASIIFAIWKGINGTTSGFIGSTVSCLEFTYQA